MSTRPLYTTNTTVTGGRDGRAVSEDGRLDIALAPPGASRPGTNPEQLIAAGYSACFLSAVKHVSGQRSLRFPDPVVDATVDLLDGGDGGFDLRIALDLKAEDPAPEVADVIRSAHQTCPYSRATRGNVAVTISLNGTPVVEPEQAA